MKRHRQNAKLGEDGFTLAELMIATLVTVLALVGILVSFIRCMELSEMAGNQSLALSAAKTRIEAAKNEPFGTIVANFNNQTFTPGGFPANSVSGASYVDSSDPNYYEITVTVCWRQKNGRVIGEDTDLDGVIDAGEDANGNGMLDSPVQLVTAIYNE